MKKKKEEDEKVIEPEIEKPKEKVNQFHSPICLKGYSRENPCKGGTITIKRWKRFPNYICVCGYTTLDIPKPAYEAAKKAKVCVW
jgi:hypothetical protein